MQLMLTRLADENQRIRELQMDIVQMRHELPTKYIQMLKKEHKLFIKQLVNIFHFRYLIAAIITNFD